MTAIPGQPRDSTLTAEEWAEMKAQSIAGTWVPWFRELPLVRRVMAELDVREQAH